VEGPDERAPADIRTDGELGSAINTRSQDRHMVAFVCSAMLHFVCNPDGPTVHSARRQRHPAWIAAGAESAEPASTPAVRIVICIALVRDDDNLPRVTRRAASTRPNPG
jgi:hypothetical protein